MTHKHSACHHLLSLPFFKRIVAILLRAVILSGIALVAAYLTGRYILPKPRLLEEVPYSKAIEDREGKLLRLTLASDQTYRLPVEVKEVSPELIQATLLYEDRCFYWHPGINPWTMGKAVLSLGLGGRKFGASTLTMQLARIRYGLNTRSWRGKLVQILRAVQIECHYTKAQILQAYLTLAPYGGNIEGVEAASRIYFGTSASRLTLDQSLILSVIPQSPTRRTLDRVGPENHPLEVIRKLWAEAHPLTVERILNLQMPIRIGARSEVPRWAMHFTEMIQHEVKQEGTIRTTLDLDWQQVAENQLNSYLERHAQQGLRNASILLLDYTTMETLVWVGSGGFWNDAIDGQCDGVQMQRCPGSTLKPFIYGLALEQGLIHPQTRLLDAPVSFADYDPENFDHKYLGWMPAREALRQSRNVPAVTLEHALKGRTLYSLLKECRVAGLKEESAYGLALALGGAEISPYKLATLYAMLANHGLYQEPMYLPGLSTPHHPSPTSETSFNAMSPEASFLALDMLQGECRPGESGAVALTRPVAWKTGTSHGFHDAWCAGVFDKYVLVVWVGDFRGESNPALTGRHAAAPLFFSLVDAIRGRTPTTNPAPWLETKDLHLVKEEISCDTGFLAGPHCLHHRPDWFIPGVSPIRESDGIGQEDQTLETLEMVSPKPFPKYYIHHDDHAEREGLALEARTGSGVKQIYWFANQGLVAQGEPGVKMWWKPTPGAYSLTLMDDQGRTTSRKLIVETRN